VSVHRQGCVFGRPLFAWPSREKVSAFLLNAKSAGGRKTRSKVSVLDTDMKKIKSKLVTIVTDNVLRVGIVKNKTLLARMLQERAVTPHRERKRKRWRCDNNKGTARTWDGSATIV
jgi:hypothetical protein